MAKKYITTPIYYINDKPHLGHAYTSIAADVLARHYRAKDEDVFFLTGTDEHGAKIADAAEKAGKDPKVFADQQSKLFENLSKELELSNDAFIRTTDLRHEKIVQEFLRKLNDNGFIYKKYYEGLYCVACEEFKTEKELVNGCCPVHKSKVVSQKEENWFFKLSGFEDKIRDLIESDKLLIRPVGRKNEILGKIKQGLDDVSISRAEVKWGIQVPWDEKQTIYVWFDALLNYYSAPQIFKNCDLKIKNCSIWPPDLHLVGRDIMWFHAVIWPAMLLAAEVELPKEIFVQGYFTVDGQKMSKTVGNVIDPVELAQKYGADAVRFYVLRDFPFGEDGDVSLKRFDGRYNNDLAAGLGNVVQRVLSMIKRYDIKLPASSFKPSANDSKIDKLTEELKFQEALVEIWKEIAAVNKEIAEIEPWGLEKQGKKKELDEFLKKSFGRVLGIANFISPYLPDTAEKIKTQAKSLELEPIFKKI